MPRDLETGLNGNQRANFHMAVQQILIGNLIPLATKYRKKEIFLYGLWSF